MTAVLVAIADAMVSDLAVGHLVDADGVAITTSHQPARLSAQLLVSRVHIPRFHPPDQNFSAYQTLVSTEGEESTRLSRSQISVEYAIQVGICGKLPDKEVATVDAALLLLQQAADFWFDYGLTGNLATWTRNQVLAWPEREMLAGDGVFFALWDCVFEGSRTRIRP